MNWREAIIRSRTLDDYMPQLICGELCGDVKSSASSDLNTWYLCSLNPGHNEPCSSPYMRHSKREEWEL